MQSVLSALRVLEEVAKRQPIGVGELARLLEMPKSSVQRALTTLGEAGWLRAGGSELTRWSVTTKPLMIGQYAAPDLGLREAALPAMNWLRDQTQETVHLSLLDGEGIVLIERVDSPQPVRAVNALGRRAPMHASASGKAALALLSDAELESILARPLERHTAKTNTDITRLRRELATIRKRGYATNNEEWRPGVAAVGRAIRAVPDGPPIAALNISAPASRTSRSRLEVFGGLLFQATAQIEQRLRNGHATVSA